MEHHLILGRSATRATERTKTLLLRTIDVTPQFAISYHSSRNVSERLL